MKLEKPMCQQPEVRFHEPVNGFTVVELLVVLAVCTVVTMSLFPIFAETRSDNRTAKCQNNLRQLTRAWLMYATDNEERFIANPGWIYTSPPDGSYMDWSSQPWNTNTSSLTDPILSPIASYVKSRELFKCPADFYQSTNNPGPRARSVSLNGALSVSGGPSFQGSQTDSRQYYAKLSKVGRAARELAELSWPGPSSVFTFLDEHPDSINDATYMFDPGWARGQERWRDLPAGFHNASGSFAFADGHTEVHRWRDIRTLSPVAYSNGPPIKGVNLGVSEDYEWMQDRMPYRQQ